MSAFTSRFFAFVDTMFGFNSAGATAETRGAPWTIFSGAMIFGGPRTDR
jgi:hypothetical protein